MKLNEYTGWLLDLYPHPDRGIVLWILCDDGHRRCFQQEFAVTFYAAGPSPRLRELWQHLASQPIKIDLDKCEEKRDLIAGEIVTLSASLAFPAKLPRLFTSLTYDFPDLNFYDADLQVSLRHAALYGTFPLARCQVTVDEQNFIREMEVLDSKWDIDVEAPPLRVLTIEPDIDPFYCKPKKITFHTKRNSLTFDLDKSASQIGMLNFLFKQSDPDLILTSHGDTWLLPMLLKLYDEQNQPCPLNRDQMAQIRYKKEHSYFAYSQVIYRGQQVHLAGRIHVDKNNTPMFDDYGVDGVLEMARVTSLPIQTVARVSPGTGISAMQIVHALESNILVPLHKEQIEKAKTATELFRTDTGGIILDPIIGLHEDVAEVDFFSMYPKVMEYFNVSAETVHSSTKPLSEMAENLVRLVLGNQPGFIPQTLSPLLGKRFSMKQILFSLSHLDCRYRPYKSRTAAHKWLLVTCFGYLGYKNARFGSIEAHEFVTAYAREIALRAKESAEDMGFRVLYICIDGLYIKKDGSNKVGDFQPVMDEIKRRTGLHIALEGIYKWVAFLPSRRNKKIPARNRYFGVFQDGEIKARGIETRQHNTPAFIRDTQLEILGILSKAPTAAQLGDYLPQIRELVHKKVDELRSGRVPAEELIVHQTVSKSLDDYRAPVPAFSALQQLEEAGKVLRLGQSIRLVYTLGRPRARAWDVPGFDSRTVNIARYRSLLDRAVETIMEPIAGEDPSWLSQAKQLAFISSRTELSAGSLVHIRKEPAAYP